MRCDANLIFPDLSMNLNVPSEQANAMKSEVLPLRWPSKGNQCMSVT